MSLPMHVGRFVVKNLQTGLLQDFFRNWDDEADDKLKHNQYEVLSMYI